MDGIMRAFAQKATYWKEDVYSPVKFARRKLSKYYAEVTPMIGLLLIAAHVLDSFQKLQSFRKWDKGMDNNPENENSSTTQYQEAFLKYVENKYCANHHRLPVIKPESVPNNNLFSSAMASRSGQSAYDPYDLSRDDKESIMPNNVAETTPGRSDPASHLLTAA